MFKQRIKRYFNNLSWQEKIKTIFSSPLGRAQHTAKIIASALNLEVQTIPEFHEKDFGVFKKKSQKAVKDIFYDFFQNHLANKYYGTYIPFPEGESYFDVYLRVLKSTLYLTSHYDNFIIVGHESINRIIRGIYTEKTLEDSIYMRQKNNQIFEFIFNQAQEVMHEV